MVSLATALPGPFQISACFFVCALSQLTGRSADSTLPLLQKLRSNRLTGTIPPPLALPETLEVWQAHSNQLSGSLPSGLRLPPRLREFWLSYNRLDGGLPTEVAFPEGLERLYLGR